MPEPTPGLVLWPSTPGRNRLCVLISDIHCTDCTVGNQTASDTDWQQFFQQLHFAVRNPHERASKDARVDELILILNGDIVDLIRSSRWAQAGVYPWERAKPEFETVLLEIMGAIVRRHALPRRADDEQNYSGFFHWLRQCVGALRDDGVKVTLIPIVGNHDKELQVVDAARRVFYEQCLGLTAEQIDDDYRRWVAAQLGSDPNEPYPRLPFYFVDTDLRLLATHGQWRDPDNARATSGWRPGDGWTPVAWRTQGYTPFTEPCFGDTVAAGLLSYFIWKVDGLIGQSWPDAARIKRVLAEIDLYRPTVAAVVRLLRESRALARRTPAAKPLHDQILAHFRDSLAVWLGHPTTWSSAPPSRRLVLPALRWLSRLRWYWVDLGLMQLMAILQEPEQDIPTRTLRDLPAFQPACRTLGLRLHVEGHTHVALEADLQFRTPRERNNYTYVNLGAWRDRIVEKRAGGFRRRGIGRALFVFHLGRTGGEDAYRFYARDVLGWGDRRDSG